MDDGKSNEQQNDQQQNDEQQPQNHIDIDQSRQLPIRTLMMAAQLAEQEIHNQQDKVDFSLTLSMVRAGVDSMIYVGDSIRFVGVLIAQQVAAVAQVIDKKESDGPRLYKP